MSNRPTLRWGIIGSGGIAKVFAAGLAASRHGRLAALASRDPSRPDLAVNFPDVPVLKGYDTLLRDPDIDAVYIALPHTAHAEWAIKAALAGKHALVEKPLAVATAEAEAVFEAHRSAGTFAGEAFMYRLHPQTKILGELITSGTIGEVRMIQSSFGFQMPRYMPEHRLFAAKLAGGGILDTGGYPVSMARFVAGAAIGRPFADPVRVIGSARLNSEGTDNWAAAILTFENGIIAQVACAPLARLDNVLRIHGSDGRLEVPDFWFAGGTRDHSPGRIDIVRADGRPEAVRFEQMRHLFSYEADAVAEAVWAQRLQFTSPGMDWADSLGNARVLDKWRADAGIASVPN